MLLDLGSQSNDATSAAAAPDGGRPEGRSFVPPADVVEQCHALAQSKTSRRSVWLSSMPNDILVVARRSLLLERSSASVMVPQQHWVAYRMWVDVELAGAAPNAFHEFVIASTLAICTPGRRAAWNGSQAGDFLAVLAEAGLLVAGVPPSQALQEHLEQSLEAFNSRFTFAQDRGYEGLTESEEGEWDGPYDFVQLADPQIGMFQMDRDWAEEMTMLRMAVAHVNRLKPRFLLVSGDLTNAWPSAETEELVRRQSASFREALRELDPSVALILQPGNHDVGQNPVRDDVERYRAAWGDDYFSFWVGGVLYISFNSQYYHIVCDNEQATSMCQEQERWLEESIRSAACRRAKHVVFLSHVAPYMGEPQEAQGHFNMAVQPRKWLLALAEEAGVRLWLCGHYHGNNVVKTAFGCEVVTTSSCGGVINWKDEPPTIATNEVFNFMECVSKPPVVCDAYHSGLRLVRVDANGFRHRWSVLASVPESFDAAFSGLEEQGSQASQDYPSLERIMGLPTSLKPLQDLKKEMALVRMLGNQRSFHIG